MFALRMEFDHMVLLVISFIVLSISQWTICQTPRGWSLPMCSDHVPLPCRIPFADWAFDFCPSPVQQQPLGTTKASTSYSTASQSVDVSSKNLTPTSPLNSGYITSSITQQATLKDSYTSSATPLSSATASEIIFVNTTAPPAHSPSFESANTSAFPRTRSMTTENIIKLHMLKRPYHPPANEPLMTIPSQLRNLLKDLDGHVTKYSIAAYLDEWKY